jgi:hypothetical protein
MVSSGVQVAPRLRSTSHRVIGVPPVTGIFFSSVGVTKPSHFPSGEKNGWYGVLPEGPAATGAGMSWSRDRR